MLDETHLARMYSVVALLETIGHMAGIPVLTAAWVEGIRIGGWGLTLPWWLSAVSHHIEEPITLSLTDETLAVLRNYICSCTLFEGLKPRYTKRL
jgi:hypothetical protein